jgi:hypothetical protein
MRIFFSTLLIVLITAAASLGQVTTTAQRIPVPEKSIPSLLDITFKSQYPDVLVHSWYATHITYWYNDISSNWYYGWYGDRVIELYTYQENNFLEVEFTNSNGELSRALYNKYGFWYETRSRLKGLPMSIIEVLKQTKYVDWKRSPGTERIESYDRKGSVFRFHAYKGLRSRIVRIDESGEIVQEKLLEE